MSHDTDTYPEGNRSERSLHCASEAADLHAVCVCECVCVPVSGILADPAVCLLLEFLSHFILSLRQCLSTDEHDMIPQEIEQMYIICSKHVMLTFPLSYENERSLKVQNFQFFKSKSFKNVFFLVM